MSYSDEIPPLTPIGLIERHIVTLKADLEIAERRLTAARDDLVKAQGRRNAAAAALEAFERQAAELSA